MKTSWLIGMATLFMIGALLSGIMEMVYLGAGGAQQSVLARMFQIPILENANVLTVGFAVLMMPVNFVVGLFNMLTWNYAFFQGSWSIVKWAVCMPISIGLIASIVFIIRGTPST